MQKTITTVIEGVPVTLEFISIGPASPDAINALEKAISSNDQEIEPKKQVKLLNIGTIDNPATPEQISQVQEAISTGKVNLEELLNKINEIEAAVNASSAEKPWWTSKIIISNVAFIAISIGAVFGFEVKLSEETLAFIGSAMGLANIVLRKYFTKKKLK